MNKQHIVSVGIIRERVFECACTTRNSGVSTMNRSSRAASAGSAESVTKASSAVTVRVAEQEKTATGA